MGSLTAAFSALLGKPCSLEIVFPEAPASGDAVTAMEFRNRVGDDRFADVAFADLQTEPVQTLAATYQSLGLTFTHATLRSVERWTREHSPGSRGAHEYNLADYGLTSEGVRERFAEYLATHDATA